MSAIKARLVISDVDGTLVTPDKVLTQESIAAAGLLREAGVPLSLISARPPRGMTPVAKALDLQAPFAAFNGGAFVGADSEILKFHPLSTDSGAQAVAVLEDAGVDVWMFAGDAWLLRDPLGTNVLRERRTVDFDPTVVADFSSIDAPIGKIVGVSNDSASLDACEARLRELLRGQASVTRSQSYYLDISSRAATKGQGVAALCDLIGVPLAETVVIGDMWNDISMFEVAGWAIAMGQAPDGVKAKAREVTTANTNEGFAQAVRMILAEAR